MEDDQCHMKVGTDAVLLAAWANVTDGRHILDIGTGSGVIALIAAQRTKEAIIDGIDILDAECAQATANVQASPWSHRIRIVKSPIQDFNPDYRYDVILCNPPYFINSLLPPVQGRTTARHTVTLTHDALRASVDRLLSDKGNASFIFPYEEGKRFKEEMEANGFYTSRLCFFRTRAQKKIERLLLNFSRSNSQDQQPATLIEELLLYDKGDGWTDEYTKLTGELYLPRVREKQCEEQCGERNK